MPAGSTTAESVYIDPVLVRLLNAPVVKSVRANIFMVLPIAAYAKVPAGLNERVLTLPDVAMVLEFSKKPVVAFMSNLVKYELETFEAYANFPVGSIVMPFGVFPVD